MRRNVTALALAALVASPATALAKAPLRPGERIDLNRATISELMRLPNVGRKRAEGIVALRGRKPLLRVEDVTAVKGISPRWIARHRASLAVGSVAAPNAPQTRPGDAAVHARLDHPVHVR